MKRRQVCRRVAQAPQPPDAPLGLGLVCIGETTAAVISPHDRLKFLRWSTFFDKQLLQQTRCSRIHVPQFLASLAGFDAWKTRLLAGLSAAC